jgi:hypothetical protein
MYMLMLVCLKLFHIPYILQLNDKYMLDKNKTDLCFI